MSKAANFAAIDLGAESGRVVLGTVTDRKLELKEVHRFPNGPVRTLDELHWDVLRLWAEMKAGVGLAAKQAGGLRGVGIDTWGVDFGLLARGDALLGNPFHYRDARTNGILEKAFGIVPREEIFRQTGIQFMQFNTVFQLLAMKLSGSPLLEMAESMLMMPDLFNFWFTGRKCNEFTNATTSQAYDPRGNSDSATRNLVSPEQLRRCVEEQKKLAKQGRQLSLSEVMLECGCITPAQLGQLSTVPGGWATDLLARLGIPAKIFGEVVSAGTVLGSMRPEVREEIGCGDVPVIAPATHDTGSAVAAVPATGGKSWAFLSSGTWSLMGMEVDRPIISDLSVRYNFTNEGGVGGTFRFLKNIMGLWLVQECRREWERAGRRYEYAELADLAGAAKPFAMIVNPDDASFLAPGGMPARIEAFCRKTGQTPPSGPGEMVRGCLESLAMAYRQTLARIEECTGRRAEVIHVVGGGIQNKHLCQWTADATGRTVVAGPIEATAAGNIAVQAVATGVLKDIAAARELIRGSFDVAVYEPKDTGRWDEPYARFLKIRG
jgi:rhamnulokinase